MEGHALIVDDDMAVLELLELQLTRDGITVTAVDSAAAALEFLEHTPVDAVLTDFHMGGMDGIELCRRIAALRPELPVVLVTGDDSVAAAVAALRAGAYDFVSKPIDAERLRPIVHRALERGRLRREVDRLERALSESKRFADIVGESPAMKRVFDLVARVAEADASVLVTGESGTGKERVARAIHSRSPRAQGPFVALNCAAVPPTLIESELFGHKAGAFTDARKDKAGLFVQADGGTLFLDEIGELPLALQPKLLRALQEREVRPVGAASGVSFDARLVCATNRDLEAEVEEGRFREDLLYRVDVVRVDVPPLRARGRDVLLLAQTFLEAFSDRSRRDVRDIDPAAAQHLLDYDWPGNVRELENCMERAVALSRDTRLTVEALPQKVREHAPRQVLVTANEPDEMPTLDELEQRYIRRVLQTVDGNKSQAAKILGIDRRTLYRRLDKHQIES